MAFMKRLLAWKDQVKVQTRRRQQDGAHHERDEQPPRRRDMCPVIAAEIGAEGGDAQPVELCRGGIAWALPKDKHADDKQADFQQEPEQRGNLLRPRNIAKDTLRGSWRARSSCVRPKRYPNQILLFFANLFATGPVRALLCEAQILGDGGRRFQRIRPSVDVLVANLLQKQTLGKVWIYIDKWIRTSNGCAENGSNAKIRYGRHGDKDDYGV